MGVAVCGGRVFFTSTRDGNSEIYSANTDGSDVRRLTNNPAIDVSPACGPGGQIAFVSSRHGGPQIFVMSAVRRRAQARQLQGRAQPDAGVVHGPKDSPLIAFTGRDGGSFDIFTVNLKTGEYTRLTQGQGSNQDPAFSPDCRMVAFASIARRHLHLEPAGLNQNKVVSGALSNVRWSR